MFVWIIMVLFFRCSYPSKLKLEFHPEQLVVCNGVDSLYFQDIRSVNDKYLITAIDYSNGLFLVFTLPTIELIQQFDLNSIAGFEEKSRGITPSAFFFHNSDSLFFVRDNSTILLLNKDGKVTDQWSNKQFLNNDLYFIASEECPLYFQDKFLFVGNANGKIILNSNENRKKYFSTITPDIIIDIQDNTIYNTTGLFPDIYKEGGAYYDFDPIRIVTDSTIIYSYGVDESVKIYDFESRELLNNIELDCDFYQRPNEFPDSELNNFGYLRDYLMSEFRFKKLIWDGKRNFLFRISYLPSELSSDGIKRKTHQNWVLSVYSNTQELLGEYFFNSDQYLPFVYPYNDSYIVLRRNNQSGKDVIFETFNLVSYD